MVHCLHGLTNFESDTGFQGRVFLLEVVNNLVLVMYLLIFQVLVGFKILCLAHHRPDSVFLSLPGITFSHQMFQFNLVIGILDLQFFLHLGSLDLILLCFFVVIKSLLIFCFFRLLFHLVGLFLGLLQCLFLDLFGNHQSHLPSFGLLHDIRSHFACLISGTLLPRIFRLFNFRDFYVELVLSELDREL